MYHYFNLTANFLIFILEIISSKKYLITISHINVFKLMNKLENYQIYLKYLSLV